MSELRQLIEQGESRTLDFKFRIDDQKKIARTLASFANTSGGKLLVGVKDNGKIVGINPEEEFFVVEGAGALFCKPEIKIQSKVWQDGHHLVLEVEVEKSNVRCLALTENGVWKSYYRIHDQTVIGNKILDKLWTYGQFGHDRPEQFSEDELAIIQLIKVEKQVSISKIYRQSNLKMAKIDSFIAALLHWKVLEMEVIEEGIKYRFSE